MDVRNGIDDDDVTGRGDSLACAQKKKKTQLVVFSHKLPKVIRNRIIWLKTVHLEHDTCRADEDMRVCHQ